MSDLEKPDRPVFEAYEWSINGVRMPVNSNMFIKQLQRAAERMNKEEEYIKNKVGRKPKPTNYNTELKIRISSKQKDALAKISSSYGLTMSQYVRELIEKDLYND